MPRRRAMLLPLLLLRLQLLVLLPLMLLMEMFDDMSTVVKPSPAPPTHTWCRLTPTAPVAATSKQPSSVQRAAANTLLTPSRPLFDMVFISATRSGLP